MAPRARSDVLIEEFSEEATPSEDAIQRMARCDSPSEAASNASEIFKPQEGFVIKTTNEEGRKVFVNVCGAEQVEVPGDWADGKMPSEVSRALDELATPSEAATNEWLRFPLSLGELRGDADHTGAACHVIDVVFSVHVLHQAALTRRLKTFIISLSLGYVGEKHGMKLDQVNYKLPRMRYKGGAPPPQRIRKMPKPLITEVAGADAADAPDFAFRFGKPRGGGGRKAAAPEAGPRPGSAGAASTAKTAPASTPALQPSGPGQKAGAVPDMAQRQKPAGKAESLPAPARQQQPLAASQQPAELRHSVAYKGCPATAAVLTVQSAALCSCGAGDLAVETCAETVFIRVAKQQLQVKLPCCVDGTSADSAVDAKAGSLTIRLPFMHYTACLKAQQQPVPAH